MKLGRGWLQKSIGEGVSDNTIGIGDTVLVRTEQGVEHEGKLLDVTGNELLMNVRGDDRRLPLGTVVIIEKRE